MALSAVALGLKLPAPPFHMPEAAPPPTAPASVTLGSLAHTAMSTPASAVAAGAMVMRMASLTAAHGPAGSFVVSVSVTPPAAISAAAGVYVALSAEAEGAYVPAPPLQVPLVAPPPTPPANCTAGVAEHT